MRQRLGKQNPFENISDQYAGFFSIPEISKSGQIAEFFDQRGYACVEKSQLTEEKATELAIEINAEEVVEAIDDDGVREVWKVSFISLCFFNLPSSDFIIVSWATNILWSNESQFDPTWLKCDIGWCRIYS